MKKINPVFEQYLSKLFSLFLLLSITLSLTINPVAAIAATTAAANAKRASVRHDSPQKYIQADAESEAAGNPVSPPVSPMLAAFSNTSSITIPDDGVSGVTSTIPVSGLVGPISSITMTITNATLPRPQHINLLLVGPGGQKFIVMSDAGGQNAASASNNVTLTFQDGATLLTQSGAVLTGTYRPVDYDVSVNFPTSAPSYSHPAPFGSATFGSVFGGDSGTDINGNWVLHVFDDSSGPFTTQNIAGGWSLDIVTTPAAAATTTTLSSSANPSFTNQAITLTATVSSTSTVNTGVVNFVDNTTGATPCVSVSVISGTATCSVSANTLTERIHQITATYVGNATFSASNGSINQEVNNPTQISGTTFTNTGTITVSDTGGVLSVPYSSNIFVSGLSGSISKVTVTLQSINFPETGDVDLLLVGPNGDRFVFWSDAGGESSLSTGTFILDDLGAATLPASGSITAGTYKPTDHSVQSDVFPAPAPSGPYNTPAPNGSATFATVFGGDAPNGKWSLYATDDAGSGGITSSIAGWRLTFTTTADAATMTTLTSAPNPSTTAQPVLFTATVSSTSTVNSGTVTFRRGAVNLCPNVAVVGGAATCNVAAGTIPEGSHLITADYSGSPGQFNLSSGTTTQVVNSPTVVTCLNFANNGSVTISNATTLGNPYPSNINVSGLAGTISKVTLTMNIGNAPTPDQTDFLLVGPLGQKFLLMGDAGGTTDIINQTITLDDAAISPLPDSTAIVTGTYRPTSYNNVDADVFPAPAPAGTYNPALPEGTATFATIFNNSNPNGTWSLYAVEDAGDAADTVINNWSLTFTLNAAGTTTTVASNANASVFGQPVTFTATVASTAGTPTGNVEFFDGATSLGVFALNGSGQASVMTSALSVATHTITAQYAGASVACTGTFNASGGSLAGGQVVNKAGTTLGLGSSSNPVPTSANVTFTATISPVAPGAGTRTGTVAFFRNSVAIPGCGSQAVSAGSTATCTTKFNLSGTYNVTATYGGDGSFNGSNNSGAPLAQQVVGPTAAAVSISGRVVNSLGRAVSNARVTLTGADNQVRLATTNPFGYFRFDEVGAGATYVFSVRAKGYQPTSLVRTLTEDAADMEIVLQE